MPSTLPRAGDRPLLPDFIGFQLRRVSTQSIAELEMRLADLQLRTIHYTVLSSVERRPGLTQNEICREVDMRPSNLVPILRDLVERQLVARHPDPDDGRSTRISLEAAGVALMDELHRRVVEHEERFFGVLSTDEKGQLMSLLLRLGRS